MREAGKQGWLHVEFSYGTWSQVLIDEKEIHLMIYAVELTRAQLDASCSITVDCGIAEDLSAGNLSKSLVSTFP